MIYYLTKRKEGRNKLIKNQSSQHVNMTSKSKGVKGNVYARKTTVCFMLRFYVSFLKKNLKEDFNIGFKILLNFVFEVSFPIAFVWLILDFASFFPFVHQLVSL